jgi:hypothetical protein
MPSDAQFIEYIYLMGHIGGQKFASSKVSIHASIRVLPLAMQALLVALGPLTDGVIFESQAFSW